MQLCLAIKGLLLLVFLSVFFFFFLQTNIRHSSPKAALLHGQIVSLIRLNFYLVSLFACLCLLVGPGGSRNIYPDLVKQFLTSFFTQADLTYKYRSTGWTDFSPIISLFTLTNQMFSLLFLLFMLILSSTIGLKTLLILPLNSGRF